VTYILHKPKLANCRNPKILPKANSISGGPDDWFSNNLLSRHDLTSVSFDFFVDWRTEKVGDDLWIKRIVDEKIDNWPVTNPTLIKEWLDDSEDNTAIKRFCLFSKLNGFTLNYILFKDSENWNDPNSPIVRVQLDENGGIQSVLLQNLKDVKEAIKRNSGGPVSIGSKGLTFGTSSLECFLSRTDSLWPGDIDSLVLNKLPNPVAIIEYKKHTLDTDIKDQELSNYYPYPDERKYKRLWLFKERLAKFAVPLIVCYYSTNFREKSVKLELIDGTKDKLFSKKSMLLDAPNMALKDTVSEVVSKTLEFININKV